MAVRTRSNFKSTKNSRFTTNGTGAITGAITNDMFEDAADSFVMYEDLGITGPSSAVKIYQQTITSAQILTSNASPVSILSAPGATSYYEIFRISCIMTGGTTVYATNTNAGFYIGAIEYLDFQTDSTANRVNATTTSFSSADILNQAITFSTSTGNPTAGDHDILVTVTYQIITL